MHAPIKTSFGVITKWGTVTVTCEGTSINYDFQGFEFDMQGIETTRSAEDQLTFAVFEVLVRDIAMSTNILGFHQT